MYRYFVQPPAFIRALYPQRIWRGPTATKTLYLTFDDGPHPSITPFVLEQLAQYQAKASFFCIGDRVTSNPALFQRLQAEGHCVGNHTYHHLNAWKTKQETYLQDVVRAAAIIPAALFRPPYGRLPWAYAQKVKQALPAPAKIVMWDLLSGDFDTSLSGQDCIDSCLPLLRSGSIVVMHDSEKAWPRLSVLLPALLKFAAQEGYTFATIGSI
jgi:peptidoglycan/xylan/chitin deacetylase (PgdA/CDA1 family)